MLLLYVLVAIGLIVFSKFFYKQKLNPISIVVVPWTLMIIGYEIKFILYNDLTLYTYIIIILSLLFYCLGTVFGNRIKVSTITNYNPNPDCIRTKIKKYMFFCLVVGGISVILSFISIIQHYGFSFYLKVSQIYGERSLGLFNTDRIPYIGGFLYIAILLAGIYFAQYGFEWFISLPILLSVLNSFVSGARQGIIQAILLFIIPIILRKKNVIKKNKRTILISIVIVAFFAFLLIFLSGQRGSYIFSNSKYFSYMSPTFSQIVRRFPGLYQVYTYCTSPVGVLNEFLKDPIFSFGKNSLFPLYNLINKFGFDIPTERYQQFYNIPIRENVGTLIRELIEDYSIFALFLIFICGIFVGHSFKKYNKQPSIRNTFVLVFLYYLACMSWFVWFLRDSNLIISLIAGIIICNRIDRININDCINT